MNTLRIFLRFIKNYRLHFCCQHVKTKCKTCNISTSVTTLGSNWVAIEVKFYEEFKFLGFMLYFSARFQQSSNKHLKMGGFGCFLDIFEDCWNLAEKYRMNPRNLNSSLNFASIATQIDPKLATLMRRNESSVKKPSVQCRGTRALPGLAGLAG